MKNVRRVLAVVVSIAILTATGCGPAAQRADIPQVPGDQVLTSDQMREDLEYTIRTLRQVHPATCRGFTDEQETLIERLRADVTKPMPSRQFYLIAAELLCSMHDGHTHLQAMQQQHNRSVDVPLAHLSGGLYIIRDCEPFRAGDRVVAVGGRPVDELVEQLARYLPTENPQWLAHQSADALTREAFLCSLEVAGEDGVDFTIQRQGERQTVTAALVSERKHKPDPPARHWVGYTIDPDASLGVFTLDSCRCNDEYKTKVKEFFTEVRDRQIRHVAVDLRRNGGGDSKVVDEFFSYLDADEYRSFGCEIRHSVASARQRGGLQWWGRSVYKNGMHKNHKCDDPSLLFDGSLYILTAVETYSSGNWFALLVKDNGLGTILGEPTGNQPTCYGDVLRFQMPNTGIYFTMSFKKWIRPDPASDPADALYPDVTVYTTIDDVLAGRDPQMDKLKNLIQTADKISLF